MLQREGRICDGAPPEVVDAELSGAEFLGRKSIEFPGQDHRLIRLRQETPKVLFLGDKEAINWHSFLTFNRFFPGTVDPAGIITPGSHIDEAVRILKFLPEHVTGRISIQRDDGYVDSEFHRHGGSFFHRHCHYDRAKITADSEYRADYNRRLVEYIDRFNPDFIFLSNYKLILPPEIVARYDGRIINVHPSVLPILKGMRPETLVANEGHHVLYSGYTIHFIDAELDGGYVLFSQRVNPPPYNFDASCGMSEKDYKKDREEQHRLDIIWAQSIWVPKVLAAVGAGCNLHSDVTPRKIVEDAEAFAIEGRAGFETTEEYAESLQIDYREWQEKGGVGSFDKWKAEDRTPYRRLLFDFGTGFKTLETVLSAPPSVEAAIKDRPVLYSFSVPRPTIESLRRLGALEDRIRQADTSDFFMYESELNRDSGLYDFTLIAGSQVDVTGIVSEHGATDLRREELNVRVGAKRRQPEVA